MKNIAFFCDTDCDITFENLKKYDINLINMPVYLNGEEYKLDLEKDPTFKSFFDAVKNKQTPTTAAINAQNYIESFEPFLKEGKDIIYVAFSSGLSATFEQLNVAIKELSEQYKNRKIYYFDTLSISIGGALIAVEAAKRLKNGAKVEDVLSFCENAKRKAKTIFAVDDLVYLKRGGRISATTAVFGGLLNIKPILRIDEAGKLVKFDKCQGMKKVVSYMYDYFVNNFDEKTDMPIYIANAFADDSALALKQKLETFLTGKNKIIEIVPIGPIVGAHCGPGTIGLSFIGK